MWEDEKATAHPSASCCLGGCRQAAALDRARSRRYTVGITREVK
ncbi:MAG: hypothetical protein Q8R39_00315 [bacterium]|nr:hypothetical protein [bacterium]